MTARSLRTTKIAVVVLVTATVIVAHRFGAFSHTPRSLAADFAALGAWGWLTFVLAYSALQPFGVPGTLFIVASPLIWPWQTAFALSLAGTMGASVVGFSFARFVARDWVSARIPARFRAFDEALERNAFRTVTLLRLIFWMPQPLHSFLGVSKVPFWTHFWGSLLGYIPPLFLVSYLGAEMFDAAGHLQPEAWRVLGALLGTSLVLAAVLYFTRRRPLTGGRAPQG